MQSKQIYINTNKLIRMDNEIHKEFKILSAKESRSIKDLLEEAGILFLGLRRERSNRAKQ